METAANETKIIYYVDDEQIPYRIRVSVDPHSITLADIKSVLARTNCRYFFKSLDSDFGYVKEQLIDDSSHPPSYDGQVICWDSYLAVAGVVYYLHHACTVSVSPITDISCQLEEQRLQQTNVVSRRWAPTSDIDSVSFAESLSDSDDVDNERCPTGLQSRPHCQHEDVQASCSSASGSSVSLTVTTVTLNVGPTGYLGIGLADPQQCRTQNIGGICVGSVIDRSPAAVDGRIAVGDVIVEVNAISLELMSDSEAVSTLRDAVRNSSQVTLSVAKRPFGDDFVQDYSGPTVTAYGEVPWQLQQLHLNTQHPPVTPYWNTRPLPSPPVASNLTVNTDALTVARAVALPNSGLKVCSRTWLKITIPRAFIGRDLVTWLLGHVGGLSSRREAKTYAARLLKAGYIKHTVSKTSFSEKCYYVFTELVTAADRDSNVGYYSSCHYSHIADNSLPTYNDAVLRQTLPRGNVVLLGGSGSSSGSLPVNDLGITDHVPLLLCSYDHHQPVFSSRLHSDPHHSGTVYSSPVTISSSQPSANTMLYSRLPIPTDDSEVIAEGVQQLIGSV